MLRLTIVGFVAALAAASLATSNPHDWLAAVALFKAVPIARRRSDTGIDFGLLAHAPRPFILTNELGVIRASNAASVALAVQLKASAAKGAHIRTLLSSDAEAEAKTYRAMRAASDGGAATVSFALGSLDLDVELSRVEPGDAILWALEERATEAKLDRPAGLEMDLETAPIGYFRADRGGTIVTMNATLAQWIGHEWPISGGFTLTDLLTDGARRLSPALARVGETVAEPAKLRTKDGIQRPVQIVQSLGDGEDGAALTRSFVFPKEPEGSTEGSTQGGGRFVRFLDDAPVSVAVISPDGVILEANDMLVEMSGGSARVGAEIAVAVRLDDRKELMERIQAVASGKAPGVPLEIKLTGDAGVEHEARFHVHRIDTERGELLLAFLLDVTEVKKIEHQLAQVQKMQAVGQLAGGIAHDVNNVLTAIRGHCDLLMLRHYEGDPDFEYLNQIRSQTERAAEVISQLLAYSRRQTMKREVTQLTDMLDDMKFMLSHLTTERVNFSVQHARDLGLVRIDRSEFQRVIMNLAVNACHAMPEGGELRMRTSNIPASHPIIAKYDVMTAQPYVQIEVEDTGEGIAKEHLPKIFEPFFTTKATGTGTGLGLSSVYGIIKQMNGFIFCDSEVGEGTVFRIFLPRYEGEMPEAAAPAPIREKGAAPRDLSGSGRVLLVEDEDAVRSFAVRALELRGYKVMDASGGEEALEIVEEDPDAIDLIVSDVIMPTMTGPEMMREVRKLRPDIRFIFISGYAEDAFREEMLDDDKFRFLAKPFSLNDLAEKVKEALTDG